MYVTWVLSLMSEGNADQVLPDLLIFFFFPQANLEIQIFMGMATDFQELAITFNNSYHVSLAK